MADLEKWIKWEPIKGLISDHYIIKSVTERLDNFTIILINPNNESNEVEVCFGNSVVAYRNTNESVRLETLSFLHGTDGNPFTVTWTFFKIENSSYVQSLCQEAGEDANKSPLLHFCFIESDLLVDVITTQEPKMKLLDYSKSTYLKE